MRRIPRAAQPARPSRSFFKRFRPDPDCRVPLTEPHNQGPVPIETGTRLGQYEVQEFIGQGAMGTVYRAYHAQLERTGAVKVMQAITPDIEPVARFRHEAPAIAKLRHP